jgi:hypothetical protein
MMQDTLFSENRSRGVFHGVNSFKGLTARYSLRVTFPNINIEKLLAYWLNLKGGEGYSNLDLTSSGPRPRAFLFICLSLIDNLILEIL